MKNANLILLTFLVIFITIGNSCTNSVDEITNRTSNFDEDWQFIKADLEGAENFSFDDSGWRKIDLPHDWSIEDLSNQIPDSIVGPFSKASIGKMATGYTVGGTAWYRKTFALDEKNAGKKAFLQFDGIYMVSDIWVNGHHLGTNTNGYTSFWYDVTPYLNTDGESNVVAVKVQNEGINARWYSGSGIYRHVWLTLVNPVHIDMWGVYITTPAVSEEEAVVDISAMVENSEKEDIDINIEVQILDPQGNEISSSEKTTSITADSKVDLKENLKIDNPQLWSTESPNLYKAKLTVMKEGKKVDELTTSFGIRSIQFDPKEGFLLNGESMLLRGGCFHHDNGPLGAKAIDRAEERKMELLKSVGYNAIRCSHNPPSPYLLDVCDRLGILVIDEIYDMWEASKLQGMQQMLGHGEKNVAPIKDLSKYFTDNWKRDVNNWIRRDRNHPSIIMWSIGNEITEAGNPRGAEIAEMLSSEVRSIDKTRAVTEALVDFDALVTGESHWKEYDPHMSHLDVLGYNYGFQKYESEHLDYPDRIYYASEFMPPLSLENWKKAEELPYVIGNFSWTAMDYLGEAGTGLPRLIDVNNPLLKAAGGNQMAMMMMFFDFNSWPAILNFQGDLDLIGNRKAASYYQSVVWRDSEIEILVHRPIPEGKIEIQSPWGFPDELKCWTWPGNEEKMMKVHVYARGEIVKLELNGNIIGEQTIDQNNSITASFELPYEPGILIARCYDINGTETGADTIKTVGEPAAIRLVADRANIKADRNDLSYVMVEILDADGNLVSNADSIMVDFKISGNAEIAGVGSGSPVDIASYQQHQRRTWHGKCLAIVRPLGEEKGRVTLSATAEGLEGTTVDIEMY